MRYSVLPWSNCCLGNEYNNQRSVFIAVQYMGVGDEFEVKVTSITTKKNKVDGMTTVICHLTST